MQGCLHACHKTPAAGNVCWSRCTGHEVCRAAHLGKGVLHAQDLIRNDHASEGAPGHACTAFPTVWATSGGNKGAGYPVDLQPFHALPWPESPVAM